MVAGQGQQALQRHRFADHRIGGPPRPQGCHPFAHKAVLAEGGIAGGQQQRGLTEFPQAQATLQQGQGWTALPLRQADGTGRQLITMARQLLTVATAAETAPQQPLQGTARAQGLEPLRAVTPAAGAGQQGHGAVAGGDGGALQAREGLGGAEPGILQLGMGIHKAWSQEPALRPQGCQAEAGGPLPRRLPLGPIGPRLQQHRGDHGRLVRPLQQLNLLQQQGGGGSGTHRAPAAVRSRTPPRWVVWFRQTTTGG